ncbi:hypothetical protein HMPREF9005_2353, partial [Actinomyces sp. oral taxon 178 str. F0338]
RPPSASTAVPAPPRPVPSASATSAVPAPGPSSSAAVPAPPRPGGRRHLSPSPRRRARRVDRARRFSP